MNAKQRSSARRPSPGRPEITSHADIEAAAFELFAEKGFERTTLDDIATALGVSRRTLFRYYASKNDIPWGQFDKTLDYFREIFANTPPEIPLAEAVQRAVLAFNDFPDDAQPSHRARMQLILETPALQAHSMLRYAEWRQVIADYVADRLGADANELIPRLAGAVCLALAVTSYEAWLADPSADLQSVLTRSLEGLRIYLETEPRP